MTYRQETHRQNRHTRKYRAKTLHDETFHAHTVTGTLKYQCVAHACMRPLQARSWGTRPLSASHACLCVPHREYVLVSPTHYTHLPIIGARLTP
jgi:hypothetical protein